MQARRHSAIRTVNRRAAGLDWKSSGRFGAGDQGLRCPPSWRVNRTGAPARLRTPMAPQDVRLRSSALRQFRLKLAASLRSACMLVAAQKQTCRDVCCGPTGDAITDLGHYSARDRLADVVNNQRHSIPNTSIGCRKPLRRNEPMFVTCKRSRMRS